jgi:SAM-dependent methyltransferase
MDWKNIHEGSRASQEMNPEEYRAMYELEEGYWWFVGMRKILAALLDPLAGRGTLRILDAGCGTGYMLSWLRRYSKDGQVVGLDVSRNALKFGRQRGERSLIQASITNLPLPSNTFDLVLSFDVLVLFSPKRAAAAISELTRVLKPGGTLFVRLAAFQSLYSSHDRATGTVHRYTRKELVRCLEAQGLILVRATYANTLLFPVEVLWRLLHKSSHGTRSDVRPLPKGTRWMNPLFEMLLSLEAVWLRRPGTQLPAGLSVIAVARKPPHLG